MNLREVDIVGSVLYNNTALMSGGAVSLEGGIRDACTGVVSNGE